MSNGTFYYPSVSQGGDLARARTPNAEWYNGVNPGAGKNIGIGINVDGGALPEATGANSIGMNWTLLDQGIPKNNLAPTARTPQTACPIGCYADVQRTGNTATTWDSSQPLYSPAGAASSGGQNRVFAYFGTISTGSNPENVNGNPVYTATPIATGSAYLNTLEEGWVTSESNNPDAFVSEWSTTVDGESITIPAQGATFNAVVDWGDNSPLETITSPTGFVHPYDTAGDYTISITGTFPNIFLNGGTSAPKLKKVLNLGKVGWTRFDLAFKGCSNLTEFTAGSTDTSAVTTMSEMFRSCALLTSLDVSNFDTSSVTDMGVMFFGCTALTSINVSSFNTSKVLNMSYMFYNCALLTSLDVSSFNTSLVNNMSNMFRQCLVLTSLDVSSFVTSSISNMALMFHTTNALTSIVGVEDWDITGLNSTGDLTNFLTGGKMTTAQYDNLLVNWEAQASGIPAMTASFGTSILTLGGAADTAKQDLINTHGWTVKDGVTPS